MKGEPSPPELINRLARLALSLGGLEQRKMFQRIRGTSDERRRLTHACMRRLDLALYRGAQRAMLG